MAFEYAYKSRAISCFGSRWNYFSQISRVLSPSSGRRVGRGYLGSIAGAVVVFRVEAEISEAVAECKSTI